MFQLSQRSYSNFEGVNTDLIDVVELAITLTSVDFGVIEGVRSVERQRELVRAGASKTMNSRHITGDAVDLLAYIGSRGSWELPLYYDIAAAVQAASGLLRVPIRWGGAWHIPDISKYIFSMETANQDYIRMRQAAGRNPFIDGPHFEIARK
jgi:peptidoglycan L-alanyl-D-glutamate endopeptidase CwlK